MDQESCDICGANAFRPLYEGYDRLHGCPGTFTVIECRHCGQLTLRPRPTPEQLSRYYPAEYCSHRPQPPPNPAGVLRWLRDLTYAAHFGYDTAPWVTRSRLAHAFAWLLTLPFRRAFPLLPRAEHRSRVLDLGCGAGAFLDRLKQLGWETHGVDISPEAVKIACSRGHRVVCGVLGDIAYADDAFDVVRANHVIEHLPAPTRTTQDILRVLKPGGLLLVALPSARGLVPRLFGPCTFSLEVPRHLWMFSANTLAFMLKQAGFTDVRVRRFSEPFLLINSWRYFLQEHRAPGTCRYRPLPEWRMRIYSLLLRPLLMLVDLFGAGDMLEASAVKPPGRVCR